VLWTNRDSLLALLLRLALLGAAAGAALVRARSPGAKLLAVWLPAALAGATLTPREFLHYAHEAVPPLALGFALVSARLRPRPLAVPAALVAMIAAVSAVTWLPALERGLVTGTPTDAPRANIPLTRLPAYYSHWFLYVTGRDSWTSYASWFPAPVEAEAREAALVHTAAPTDESSLLVLGGAPWLYAESGLAPAGPDLVVVDNFPVIPDAEARARALLVERVPSVVVVGPGAPAWAWAACRRAGYRQVSTTPWPIFSR
jgi:hypothetical protein